MLYSCEERDWAVACSSVHDEAVWVIPADANAEKTYQYLIDEMRRPPTWMPDIPLDAEGSLSEVYEK